MYKATRCPYPSYYEDAGASGNRREMENQTGQELEALAIAQRIKEIVGKEQMHFIWWTNHEAEKKADPDLGWHSA